MKLKYILAVVITFSSVFAFNYGLSSLYAETNSIENYYKNKIEENNNKYEDTLYKKEIIEIQKIQEKIEADRKKQLLIQKKAQIAARKKEQIIAQNKRIQSQAIERARQKKLAQEKVQVQQTTIKEKTQVLTLKKKSRSSRAS